MKLMLCKTGDEGLLDKRGYAAELKADGTHVRVEKHPEKTEIFGRPKETGIPNYTPRLPELVEAFGEISAKDFQMVGEVVVWKDGRTWFEGSQRRCSTEEPAKIRLLRAQMPVVLLAFDLTRLDGKAIEQWTYEQRKKKLYDILKDTPQHRIQYLPHFTENKREFYDMVVAKGEEGVILKKLGSPYERRRSRYWLKVKRWYEERVKVVGFTPGTGQFGHLFGALVLAKPDDDGFLEYVGKVGTGFSVAEREKLSDILNAGIVVKPTIETPEPYTPVKIPLEVTVKFFETTKTGVYRFPSLVKDELGNNLIHYNEETLAGKPKPRDLRSIFESLSRK